MLQPNNNYWYLQKSQQPPPYNPEHGRNYSSSTNPLDSSVSRNQSPSQNEQYRSQVNWSASSQLSNLQASGTTRTVPPGVWTPPYMGYENLEPSRTYNYHKTATVPSQYERPQSQPFMGVHSKGTAGAYSVPEVQNNRPSSSVPRIRVRDVFSLNNSINDEISGSNEGRNGVPNSPANFHPAYSNAQTLSYGRGNNISSLYQRTSQNQVETPSGLFRQEDGNTVIWRPQSQYHLPNAGRVETSVPRDSLILSQNVMNREPLSSQMSGNYNSRPGVDGNVLVNRSSPQTNPVQYTAAVPDSSNDLRTVFVDNLGTKRTVPSVAQPRIDLNQTSSQNNIQVANFPFNCTQPIETIVSLITDVGRSPENCVARSTEVGKSVPSTKANEKVTGIPDSRSDQINSFVAEQNEGIESSMDVEDVKVPFDDKLLASSETGKEDSTEKQGSVSVAEKKGDSNKKSEGDRSEESSSLKKYEQRINRKKLGLLIEFLEGGDCSKKRKSSKNSVDNSEAGKGAGVAEVDENIKKPEKGVECDNKEPEEQKDSLERTKESVNKKDGPEKISKKSSGTEMTVTREEVKIIDTTREILKLDSYFCRSCNLKSPVGCVWINPVSGKIRCLNCFKNRSECNKPTENGSYKKERAEPKEELVSKSKKRANSSDRNVENLKKAKPAKEKRNDEFWLKDSSKKFDSKSEGKRKPDRNSRNLSDIDKKAKKHERRKSLDSRSEDRVAKTNGKSRSHDRDHKKSSDHEHEDHRRKMLEELHRKTKKLSWALLKES